MILKTEKLVKRFGGNVAVNQVSIEIAKNKITAVIGPNGSGKSTLFNLISKLYQPDDGIIRFNERNITKEKDFQLAKTGFSRTFQELRVFPYLSIQDHMRLAVNQEDEQMIKNLITPNLISQEIIKDALHLVGLEQDQSSLGKDLSYGQSKLLNLAMGIAHPHELLLLDEPVAGVNPRLRKKIADILKELHRQGETILLIEHDMNFVTNIVDYVFVMNEGSILAEGTVKEILNKKEVLEAYLGN